VHTFEGALLHTKLVCVKRHGPIHPVSVVLVLDQEEVKNYY